MGQTKFVSGLSWVCSVSVTFFRGHLHKNKIVGSCLIDIEKVFDSVWNGDLVYVLIQKNYHLYLIYLIWDMITNKSFVTWDGKIISTLILKILEGLSQ